MRIPPALSTASTLALQGEHGASRRARMFLAACTLALLAVALSPIGSVQAHADTSADDAAGRAAKPEATITVDYVDDYPNLVYNGLPQLVYQSVSAAYTPENSAPGSTAEYAGGFILTFSGTGDTSYGPTDQAPRDVGTYTVTFATPDEAPCAGSVTGAFSIVKAPATTFAYPYAELLDGIGWQKSFDVSVAIDNPGGKPSFSITSFTKNGLASAAIDPATGVLTIVANGKLGKTAETVTDTVWLKASMGNYEDSTLEVTVHYTEKPVAIDRIGGVQAAAGLVDNGKPQAGYTGSPSITYLPYLGEFYETYTGPFDITYTGSTADGTPYGPSLEPPAKAGSYLVTFAVPESAYFTGQPLALEFSIASAPAVLPTDPTDDGAADDSQTRTALAATGDNTLPGLPATIAGAAVLIVGLAFMRIRKEHRS